MKIVSRVISNLKMDRTHKILCYNVHSIVDYNNEKFLKKLMNDVVDISFGEIDRSSSIEFVNEENIKNDIRNFNPLWIGIPSMGIVVGICLSGHQDRTLGMKRLKEIIYVKTEPITDPVLWLEKHHYIDLDNDGYDNREIMKRIQNLL